jgi:hypothetical protein
MGLFYWKGHEYNSFRSRDDGDWDFFPNNAWTGGYRVNAEQRERIAAGLRRYYVFGTALIFAGVALGTAIGVDVRTLGHDFLQVWHIIAVLSLFGALILYRFIALRPLWRGLPRADRRLRFGERQTHLARTAPKWRIISLPVVGLLWVLISLRIFWLGNEKGDGFLLIFGSIALLLAIAFIWAGSVMWRKRQAFERGKA